MKKFVITAVFIHMAALELHGASGFASSSQETAPLTGPASLQEKSFKTLIAHPGILAHRYQQVAMLHPEQQDTLFIESVQRALSKRIGLAALNIDPHIPLTERFFNGKRPTFSPDGTILAIADRNEVSLYNMASGQQIRTFKGDFPKFSSDGNIIASLQWDQNAQRYDTEVRNAATGLVLQRFAGESHAVLSPDGATMVTDSRNADHKREMHVWHLATGQLIGSFVGNDSPQFSPDGRIVALTSSNYRSDTDTHITYLLDTTTGQLIEKFKGRFPTFNANGTLLAYSLNDDTHLWHIQSKQDIHAFQGLLAEFSPDSTMLATSIAKKVAGGFEYTTRIWNIARKQLISEFGGRFLAFTSDNSKVLVYPSSNSVCLIDLKTGLCSMKFRGIDDAIFTPNGTIVAMPIWELNKNKMQVDLRSAKTWELIETFKKEHSPIFSPDGAILATYARGVSILREPNFRPYLELSTDPDERILLLTAAQDWLEGKPRPVKADDFAYQNIIKRIADLNGPVFFESPLLFEIQEAAQKASEQDIECTIL